MPLRITLPDHVVIGDVHMDRLHREFVEQRLQATLSLLGSLCNQPALVRIGNHRQQMADQSAGVARVPLQGALKARMLEIGQGQVHLSAQPAKASHQLRPQVIQVGQGMAFDEIEQAHMYRLSGYFQRKQVGTVVGRDHPRHSPLGMLAQMPQPGVLGLQLQGGVIAMADFQDKPTLIGVDAKVEVLLAAQGLHRAAQPVVGFQQLQRLLRANLRTWQAGTVNQRGEQHTTTPGNYYQALISPPRPTLRNPPGVTVSEQAKRHYGLSIV